MRVTVEEVHEFVDAAKNLWHMLTDKTLPGYENIEPCRECGHRRPCYGLPCELSDRLAKMRESKTV